MQQKDLLLFALNNITKTGRMETKDLIVFIEALLADPEAELTKIKTDMHAEFVRRQTGQVAYKQKLDADVATLQTLDVTEVINEAREPK